MKNQFEIPFVGLKIGIHDFEFKIDKSFFESMPYSLIEDGDLKVWMELEKKETMLIADFELFGTVKMACARCNEEMDVEIEGELTVYYKFGNEETEDENLFVIPFESYQIDVSQPIYELITISIPPRAAHEDDECDEEMVRLIEKYQQGQTENKKDNDNDDDIDPRWSALKNLN